MLKEWQLIRSVPGPSFKVFSVRTDTVRSPRTQVEHDFYIIESPPWVSILAFNEEGEIIMVRQYRHGIGKVTLELPGGLAEGGMPPGEAARKELLEETGYLAGEVVLLGRAHPQPAILNNCYYCYLAQSAEKVGKQSMDSAEDIEVVSVPVDKVLQLIKNGDISHALVITAFFWYFGHAASLVRREDISKVAKT